MDFTKTKHVAIECHGKRDLMDLEHHIHCLEIEAYSSVLKAFIAQSDLLTWGKEELMTDLRKELNVTDIEHGEILIAVHLDESVKRIREQRLLASHAENYVKLNNPGYASGSMRNSSIIMKTSSPVAYFPQKNMSHCQSSLAPIPIPSSMPPKFKDDRNTTGLAMFSHGNAGKSTEIINHNVPLPSRGRAVKVKHQLKKGFRNSDFGNRKNRTDLIEMRATDWVILDVEKMLFNGGNPDPLMIAKAKSTLGEQERAILEALAKLTDVLERHDSAALMRHYPAPKDNSALGIRK